MGGLLGRIEREKTTKSIAASSDTFIAGFVYLHVGVAC